jgi:probable rRNA maturation factor
MLEVDVLGARLAPAEIPPLEVRRLCEATAGRLAVSSGHVAVEFVDEERIAQLNARHRGRDTPTDVLSFPIDGADAARGGDGARAANAARGAPVELGDVVICAACTADVGEAIVHGMLHLLGMDHETDHGEMLALQRELLAELRP